jgi:hypothetical protein
MPKKWLVPPTPTKSYKFRSILRTVGRAAACEFQKIQFIKFQGELKSVSLDGHLAEIR